MLVIICSIIRSTETEGVAIGVVRIFNVWVTAEIHGFVRAVNGSITTFDPPGSVLTLAGGINPMGTITGQYFDASGVSHGFLRSP